MSGLRRTLEFEFTNGSGNTAVIRVQEPGSWTKAQLSAVFEQIANEFGTATVQAPEPEPAEAETQNEEPSPWAVLDEQRNRMHGKVRHSIDQALLAVAAANERGPAASYEDISRKAHLSYATVTKLFREDHPHREYIGALFRVTKDGRSFKVDLTKAGRTMASRIRAGAA